MHETLNIGLVGAGWFGREAHLSNLLQIDGVNVLAASSRSTTSLSEAQAICGDDLLTFTNWHELLDIQAIDAVIIALTNDQHHAASLAAFHAGKHVLCEKPLGLTVQQCDEIIAASRAANRILQVGHEMRFQRLYQEAKNIVDCGGIGDLHLMWCRELRGPMREGWRSSQQLTGGTLLEKNSHHFDLFNWMLGKSPLRVAALGGRNVLLDREVLDNAQVLVEHEDGRRSMLELCLFAPSGGDTEIGFVGTQGLINTLNQTQQLTHHRFEGAKRTALHLPDSANETGFKDASGRIDRGIRAELEHFLECCHTGGRPLTDGSSARQAVAVCIAAEESIRREEMVTVEEIVSGRY